MYIFLFSLFLALVVTPAFSVDATYDAEKKEWLFGEKLR